MNQNGHFDFNKMENFSIQQKIVELLGKYNQRVDKNHLFIGIGGGSASGKSTIANRIKDQLDELDVLVINQDRFFKPPAQMPQYFSQIYQEKRPDYNHPDSFNTGQMFAYCRGVDNHDVVILEGILALYYPELRGLMDRRQAGTHRQASKFMSMPMPTSGLSAALNVI